MPEPKVGIALLFSGDPVTGEVNMDVFREDDDWAGSGRDPFHRAEGLRESIVGDFPERLFAIALNERARVLMTARRLQYLLGISEQEAMDAAEVAVKEPAVVPLSTP